jgi:hypothetical protein
MSKIDLSLTAQQQHDRDTRGRNRRLARQTAEEKAASKARVEALLLAKSREALLDPIECAMRNNPGLTREEAEKFAAAFGF